MFTTFSVTPKRQREKKTLKTSGHVLSWYLVYILTSMKYNLFWI